MLSKILGACLVVCIIAGSIFGWKYKGLVAENATLTAKVVAHDIEVSQLKAQIASVKVQEDFKAKELQQTSELLDTCYKALAGQTQDFDTINQILQLPARERTNECNPDQDAACLDFLNRQLLDVK